MHKRFVLTAHRLMVVFYTVLAAETAHNDHPIVSGVFFFLVFVLIAMAAHTDKAIFELLEFQNSVLGAIGMEEGSFAIRMASGMYFAPTPNQPLATTPEIENAKHYPTRFAALEDCARGIEFKGAAIVTYSAEPAGGQAAV